MASKNKKSKNQKRAQAKNKKQQRRQQRTSKRPSAGSLGAYATGNPAKSLDEILMDDMWPLFRKTGPNIDGDEMLTIILLAAMEGDRLLAEPEFEDIGLAPVESFARFIGGVESRGYGPNDYFTLDDDTQAEVFFEVMDEVIPEVLSEELHTEIAEATDALWRRLRRIRSRRKDLPVAAATLMAMRLLIDEGAEEDKQLWGSIGIVKAMYENAIEEGLKQSIELMEIEEYDEAPELLEELNELTGEFDPGNEKAFRQALKRAEKKAKPGSKVGKLLSQIKATVGTS